MRAPYRCGHGVPPELVSVARSRAEARRRRVRPDRRRGLPLAETVFRTSSLKGDSCRRVHGRNGNVLRFPGYDCVAAIPRHQRRSSGVRDHDSANTGLGSMVTMMNSSTRPLRRPPLVTCFTCHHAQFPRSHTESRAAYGDVIDDPNSIRIALDRRFTADRFLTSMSMRSAERSGWPRSRATPPRPLSGFNTSGNEAPIEIVAKAPNQRVEPSASRGHERPDL